MRALGSESPFGWPGRRRCRRRGPAEPRSGDGGGAGAGVAPAAAAGAGSVSAAGRARGSLPGVPPRVSLPGPAEGRGTFPAFSGLESEKRERSAPAKPPPVPAPAAHPAAGP